MIDQTMLTQLQYDLVEPQVDAGVSWDSGLWSREEVLGALNFRQSLLLKSSLLVVSIANPQLTVTAGNTTVDLPADWIRTVDAVWIGADGTTRELLRCSTFEMDHVTPSWAIISADPLSYVEYETPTLEMTIGPTPRQDGVIDLLYIARGPALTGDGMVTSIPDELSDAVVYGALTDLLSKDGRGQDLLRAQYCQQRYELAVDLARLILEGWA